MLFCFWKNSVLAAAIASKAITSLASEVKIGYGDEIMAVGCARVEHERTGLPIRVKGANGLDRWSSLWEGVSYILHPDTVCGEYATIFNGPHRRPYLESLSRDDGAIFTDWRARDHIGEIALSDDELSFAAGVQTGLGDFVVIEPNLADIGNPNKQWGKWREFVAANPCIQFVQFVHSGAVDLIDGVRYVDTRSFRDACAVLSVARAAVLPEGGLHHAAGVLGVPSVVIFGGHTSPETTGYGCHINLYPNIPGSPCGQWTPCDHCKEAMSLISVDDVTTALTSVLHDG